MLECPQLVRPVRVVGWECKHHHKFISRRIVSMNRSGGFRLLNIAVWIQVSHAVAYFMNQTNGTVAWCSVTNCLGASNYSLVVGQPVSFNVTAMNIQSQNSAVYIDVLNDPGLPNGAQISATVVAVVQVFRPPLRIQACDYISLQKHPLPSN